MAFAARARVPYRTQSRVPPHLAKYAAAPLPDALRKKKKRRPKRVAPPRATRSAPSSPRGPLMPLANQPNTVPQPSSRGG